MAEAFQQLEEADAIRLSWNVWPNSRLEATKSVVPFGALYTPIKRLQNMPVSWRFGKYPGKLSETCHPLNSRRL